MWWSPLGGGMEAESHMSPSVGMWPRQHLQEFPLLLPFSDQSPCLVGHAVRDSVSERRVPAPNPAWTSGGKWWGEEVGPGCETGRVPGVTSRWQQSLVLVLAPSSWVSLHPGPDHTLATTPWIALSLSQMRK